VKKKKKIQDPVSKDPKKESFGNSFCRENDDTVLGIFLGYFVSCMKVSKGRSNQNWRTEAVIQKIEDYIRNRVYYTFKKTYYRSVKLAQILVVSGKGRFVYHVCGHEFKSRLKWKFSNFLHHLCLMLCDYGGMAKWVGAHCNQEVRLRSTVKCKKERS